MSRIARLVRGERQKELVKVFDEACGRHNRWEVWSDAIVMYAIAISNSLDKSHFDSREKMYMNIVQKYNKREMECISRMFALIVEAIDQNPDQDFLGDLFMSLELGNQKGGQFFTPYSVCKLMEKMNSEDVKMQIEENGWIGVNDPACGAGALLVAFANECLMQKVNYQTSVLFVAQDIDLIAGCMCYIQLSLLGCPGYVVVANTITHPATSIDGRALIPVPGENVWYTPFYFRDVWHWRRIWNQMGKLFQTMPELKETPAPELPPPEPSPKEVFCVTEHRTFSETKTGQLSLF